MKKYNFSIDLNGELVCSIVYQGEEVKRLYGKDASIQLERLDKHKYNSSRTSKRDFTLFNDEEEVKFENYNDFYSTGMIRYFSNHRRKVTETIRKYKQNQHKKRTIHNIKRAVTGVVLSATIATLIGVGVNAFKAEAYKEKEEEPVKYEQMMGREDKKNGIEEKMVMVASNVTYSATPTYKDEVYEQEETVHDIIDISETPTMSEINQGVEEEENVVYLDYTHKRDSEKGDHAYDNYYEIVDKYANKWGISPNMIMSMLTQESGGYHKNLMQIQFWSWEDQVINVYNFEDNKYEKVVLTEKPEEYKKKYDSVITIGKEDLNNPITNISIGSVLLRESARLMNNHIAASIQCYNFGYGNMKKVLNATALQNDCTVADLLSDQENIDFVRNTRMISVGDPDYLAHVMQYTNDLNEGFTLKEVDKDGNISLNQVRIMPTSSMRK